MRNKGMTRKYHNLRFFLFLIRAVRQSASEPRLGYMGHLTLMAVDIIAALEKYPDDFRSILEPLLPQPAWAEYVIGAYAETQRMENIVLGGPRPQSFARNATQSENGWGGDWNDEEDSTSPGQEFRRGAFSSRQTADFGVAPEEEDDGTFHFNPSHGFGGGGWAEGSSSDSEDEHEAWIKNSDSAAPHHSRDSENMSIDDSFEDSFQSSGVNQGSRELTQEEEVSSLSSGVSLGEINTVSKDDGFGAFANVQGNRAHFDTDFGHEDFDFGEFQSGEFDEQLQSEGR
jgi:serine/threonine-protein phosphatase 6 regulatory subunit 3